LVESGANVNHRDHVGVTALFWATGEFLNISYFVHTAQLLWQYFLGLLWCGVLGLCISCLMHIWLLSCPRLFTDRMPFLSPRVGALSDDLRLDV